MLEANFMALFVILSSGLRMGRHTVTFPDQRLVLIRDSCWGLCEYNRLVLILYYGSEP
jgi:hypothetical protein